MKTSREYQEFNAAMDTILKADPAKVKAEMDEDKQQRDEARKAKGMLTGSGTSPQTTAGRPGRQR
ncbi:MAG: hypothetical protein WCF30_14485 [Terracidiphilus sp.]